MISELHVLRPWCLLALLPCLGLSLLLWRQKTELQAWKKICDPHLLAHLIQKRGANRKRTAWLLVTGALFFMILAMAGPAWHQLPVITYKPIQPRVLLLDMSEHMLQDDLSPNRLARAKFKLHDLFSHKDIGQFALIAFTAEPFVVSPLTDDGQTISALLSALTPDVMPVGGQDLSSALKQASQLIEQAGYHHGQVLVLTADTPSEVAAETARTLASKGIFSSIMPIRAEGDLNPLFQKFATLGHGTLLHYTADPGDLEQWLKLTRHEQSLALDKENNSPLWQDEGRWFLIPALLLLLPVFRRGWR